MTIQIRNFYFNRSLHHTKETRCPTISRAITQHLEMVGFLCSNTLWLLIFRHTFFGFSKKDCFWRCIEIYVYKQSLGYSWIFLDPVQLSYNACKGSWVLGARPKFMAWNSNNYSSRIRCAFRDNQRSTRVPSTNSFSISASTNNVRGLVGRACKDWHSYVHQVSWPETIHYNDMLNVFVNFC